MLACADTFDLRFNALSARAGNALASANRRGGQKTEAEAAYALRKALFELRSTKLPVQPLRMRALLSPRASTPSGKSITQQRAPLTLAAGRGGGPWVSRPEGEGGETLPLPKVDWRLPEEEKAMLRSLGGLKMG